MSFYKLHGIHLQKLELLKSNPVHLKIKFYDYRVFCRGKVCIYPILPVPRPHLWEHTGYVNVDYTLFHLHKIMPTPFINPPKERKPSSYRLKSSETSMKDFIYFTNVERLHFPYISLVVHLYFCMLIDLSCYIMKIAVGQ